jgi:hypothetical protein
MRIRALLTPFLVVAAACGCGPSLRGTLQRDDLLTIVERDLIRFTTDLPEALIDRLADHRVLVVGEYHDISGHDAFVGDLVVALQPRGLTTVLLEFPQAHGWLLDAYVRGVADTPGEGALRTYGPLLDRIRAANAAWPPEQRIAVRAIDVNPSREDFLAPFRGLTRVLGRPGPLVDLVGALEAGGGADEALAAAQADLRERATDHREAWGDLGYTIVSDALDGEVRSAAVRAVRAGADRDAAREVAMQALVDRQLAIAPGNALVNVGYFHAQKRRQVGTVDAWLAEHLVDASPHARGDAYVLVVAPASGEKSIRGRVRRFDVGQESPQNELFRVMQGVAGGATAFLPLDDEAFATERLVVNYLPELIVGPPRAVFDAFVLLPEVRYVGR